MAWAQASLGLVNVDAKPPKSNAPLPLLHRYSNKRDAGLHPTPALHSSTAKVDQRGIIEHPPELAKQTVDALRDAELAIQRDHQGAAGTDLPYHLHRHPSWWPPLVCHGVVTAPGPSHRLLLAKGGDVVSRRIHVKASSLFVTKGPVPHAHLQAAFLTLQSISTRPPTAPGPGLIPLSCLFCRSRQAFNSRVPLWNQHMS